uniref:Serine carboxypeptidase-like 50 n=1 Tax=Gossypium raimondii TaxID=29730 RepID=A0A0D2PTU7_GOSRA|nr:hypothetical protein B456_005G161500 [Gossypium raimondii]
MARSRSTTTSAFFFLCLYSSFYLTASTTPLFPKDALPTKSGYLPVNHATGSAIFYAFYEAQTPTSPLSKTPLLIWLQGGPGCSSMIGNLFELGPWRVVSSHMKNAHNLTLERNPGSWNRLFGLLFLDNPIGTGFINERQKGELEEAQREAVELVKMGNWSEATNARSKVLSRLQNMTGLATLYDFTKKIPYQTEFAVRFLNIAEVKRALGVNESMVFEECSDVVGDVLHEDVMKSVKYMVEFLVKNSKVLLYQGLYDLRDGVVSTEAWVKTMKWEGIEKFKMADRVIWKVNGELAGYLQKWGSLTNVVVSGAGHLLPADQALNSQAMTEDWVLEKGQFGGKQRGSSTKFRATL